MDTPATTRTLRIGTTCPVDITVRDHAGDRPFLLLHGGGGAPTMAGFAALLAGRTGSRVLLPTHPGFAGTPKAAGLTGVTALARAYVAMLEQLGLTGVTVVGNSFGGWLAAEIAALNSPRVAAAVIVDGIGVEVPGHTMLDVSGLSRAELLAHSFHDPDKAPVPPGGGTGPSPDVQALIGYTGPAMSDPALAGRLAAVDIPVHVLWGESDRVATPAYGKEFAAAIPAATFTLLPRTGHLPQVETPEDVLAALLTAVGR
ncbi:alpha/beta fold hydrolase [Actinacidiphila bryophytorum]|uniref:Alpha/beta hydrolase n=1 Tax=Actinacidiphila bryophytorum TaxID=1436133 RepID=A0A9W4MI78_9ACTN|nr:alpha/beta hydrolase [Actinacidiphila bryophytorum]MBM9436985.1 alpha/beta hydrolase [Actinacidiphila bryophytorum]MBN6542439.1 alpha/beta hydrolase [Actinacidiphila bryophytorum]CAG7646095.1 Alpha/beta hydrolase [Actinacidiphila bryophytorum]